MAHTHDDSTVRSIVRQALLALVSEAELDGWFEHLHFQCHDGALVATLCDPALVPWFHKSVLPLLARALEPTGLSVHLQTPRPHPEEYSLDGFLTNGKNAFPLASAREVAEDPSARFNPFTVCGESGSGKTFLVRAIANAKARNGATILSTNVADLAATFQRRSDARDFVLAHTVFILDDLQDLEFHENLQSELILLFDRFHASHSQMVFACTGSLASCPFLQPKLRSRLEWGLIVTLKAPDLDVRLQFIERWRRNRGLALSRDRELLLAQRFGDMRLLEGTLLKLLAYSDLVSPHITDEEFEKILHYTAAHPPTSAVRPEDIIRIVSETCAVPQEDILGQGRRREVAWARQVAMYLCRKLLRLSYPELGRLFGGRDHTTALYACRKVEQDMAQDPGRKAQVHDISRQCRFLSNHQP